MMETWFEQRQNMNFVLVMMALVLVLMLVLVLLVMVMTWILLGAPGATRRMGRITTLYLRTT